jgi:nitrite reductase/ring-hydroxylating ferredoxin subunit
MRWEKVLQETELPEGRRQVVKVGDRDVLLLRTAGAIHAVGSACPHMRLPLKRGRLTEDGGLVCPWHRSEFDLATGEVRQWVPWPPGVRKVLEPISRGNTLPVFPTRVEDGAIWVGLETD